jgi:hypothetical protein
MPAGPAQLVISEIMPNPAAQSDTAGEYFEILNSGGSAMDLLGLVVQDAGTDSFTVGQSVIVPAAGRVVLAKSATAAGGQVDYVYGSGMNLTNTADSVVLVSGGQVVDQVAYDASFPLVAGRAMEVTTGAESQAANDNAASWCASDSPLSDGDFGTPRTAAGACVP